MGPRVRGDDGGWTQWRYKFGSAFSQLSGRVPGPHGFAVRFSAARPSCAASVRSRITALQTLLARDAAASTPTCPNVRDDGQRSTRQVTQRPGSSSFATSVKTLTGGSQATAFFDLPDFTGATGRRASSLATGTRTSTEVSARLLEPERDGPVLASRDRGDVAVGLGGTIDALLGRGRGNLPKADEVMARSELGGAERRGNGQGCENSVANL